MEVQTYLFFDGRCEEAFEFYRRTLGAQELMKMRFKESPEPANTPPNAGDKIMHMSFRVGNTTIMASDGHCGGRENFQGFGLSITLPSEALAERIFNALADGGQVRMPMTKTFFSPRFGMVADKFGVMWMVMVESGR